MMADRAMDREAMSKLEAVCRELGLDTSLVRRIVREAQVSRAPGQARGAGSEPVPGDDECVRAERDRLLQMEAEIMKLLGSSSRETIVHDLRNVLNDLNLLQELRRGV
jgi:hypothetical protein